MSTIQSDVAVKEFPQISVELISGVDWVTIGSIGLTAFVVIVTTIVTIKNFSKTIRSQEKIEREKVKAETLSKNRQNWINTLRNAISDYMAELSRVHDSVSTVETKLEIFKKLEAKDQVNSSLDMYSKFDSHLSNAFALKTKIALLLNPNEDASNKLVALIESSYLVVSKKDQNTPEKLDFIFGEIVIQSQSILKTEWERVKNVE